MREREKARERVRERESERDREIESAMLGFLVRFVPKGHRFNYNVPQLKITSHFPYFQRLTK